MPRPRPAIPALHALALLLSCAMPVGCQTKMRIPDAPAPVETEPVTALAGYGMELRLWALDASSWRRTQDNAELARLYEQWQEIQAQRASVEQPAQGAHSQGEATERDEVFASTPAGPPITPEDQVPDTFEAYVRAHQLDAPSRPGMDVLSKYLELRGAIDPQAASIWERNGFTLALVPMSDLVQLRSAMGVPGPLERTWWGAIGAWSHLAKGVATPNRRLATDLGPLLLGSGRFALVGRAWPAPSIGDPVLRLEICPQFLPVRQEASRLEARLTARLEANAGPVQAIDEGPVFQRFLLSGSIPRGYALILMPSERESQVTAFGPTVPDATLAESVLTARGPDGSLRPVALVVVPVLPERFSLDGR